MTILTFLTALITLIIVAATLVQQSEIVKSITTLLKVMEELLDEIRRKGGEKK